jgi:hypothetical protein
MVLQAPLGNQIPDIMNVRMVPVLSVLFLFLARSRPFPNCGLIGRPLTAGGIRLHLRVTSSLSLFVCVQLLHGFKHLDLLIALPHYAEEICWKVIPQDQPCPHGRLWPEK